MKTVASLGEIAGRYDAIICDVWGVVHDGRSSFPAACEALARFRAERGPVLLLSNAPRPGDDVTAMLDALEVTRDCYDTILTSGDATRAELGRRAGQSFIHVGPARDRSIWEDIDVREAKLEEAAFILCTGLTDDESETPDDYAALLAQAKELAVPMICANPDQVVHRGARLIWCAGALADAYEKLGGAVTYFGKPHPPVYDQSLAKLNAIAGKKLDETRILAIGDGLRTDVLGANRAGIDVLFISSGVHGEKFGEADAPDHAKIVQELDAEEVFAVGTIPRLVW